MHTLLWSNKKLSDISEETKNIAKYNWMTMRMSNTEIREWFDIKFYNFSKLVKK
jgi:hypothetical protein